MTLRQAYLRVHLAWRDSAARLWLLEKTWRIRHARFALQGRILPCDVLVSPATIVSKGCDVNTLMSAVFGREKWSEAAPRIDPGRAPFVKREPPSG